MEFGDVQRYQCCRGTKIIQRNAGVSLFCGTCYHWKLYPLLTNVCNQNKTDNLILKVIFFLFVFLFIFNASSSLDCSYSFPSVFQKPSSVNIHPHFLQTFFDFFLLLFLDFPPGKAMSIIVFAGWPFLFSFFKN